MRQSTAQWLDMPRSMQEDEAGCWAAFTSLVITTGKRDSNVLQYFKSVAFHQWLFGLEVAGALKTQKLYCKFMESLLQLPGGLITISSAACRHHGDYHSLSYANFDVRRQKRYSIVSSYEANALMCLVCFIFMLSSTTSNWCLTLQHLFWRLSQQLRQQLAAL